MSTLQDDVEQEKAQQRSIIDSLLGHTSSGTSQQRMHSKPSGSLSNHAHEERGLDLKGLFSGQQFSFLAEKREASQEPKKEEEEEERSGAGEAAAGGVGTSDKRELFFFHWCNTDLANRLDCSYHSSRGREQLEQGWLKQRSDMRQLLRQSHRQAVRARRLGKKRQILTNIRTSLND